MSHDHTFSLCYFVVTVTKARFLKRHRGFCYRYRPNHKRNFTVEDRACLTQGRSNSPRTPRPI